MLKLKLTTPPPIEPVTLDEIKDQLRIERGDPTFDELITPLIPAARQWCEGYQNRAYITQTWEFALDSFPQYEPYHQKPPFDMKRKQRSVAIELPRPPLQTVNSFRYITRDNTSVTIDSGTYIVDDFSEPSELVPVSSWPQNVQLRSINGVIVQYTAGYGDRADDVPEKIRQAITLLVVHWFENGMCYPPCAVLSLLNLDRVVPL